MRSSPMNVVDRDVSVIEAGYLAAHRPLRGCFGFAGCFGAGLGFGTEGFAGAPWLMRNVNFLAGVALPTSGGSRRYS